MYYDSKSFVEYLYPNDIHPCKHVYFYFIFHFTIDHWSILIKHFLITFTQIICISFLFSIDHWPILIGYVAWLAESLFNAFATAAFFKFVVFSIFEMRYLLAIWKAGRSMNSGEGWEAMRRELSVLYSRFCKYLSLKTLFYIRQS